MWDEILKLVTAGSLFGLPTFAFMSMPFIVGLVVGFLLKKAAKIGLILLVLSAAGMYFGVFSISFDKLKHLGSVIAPTAQHGAAVVIGMLPLGTGLIVGLILGFKYG
jgi:uncharacterized membrane protein (Fun14 family)